MINDENGETLTETEKITDRWKRYCEEMYSDNQPVNKDQSKKNNENLEDEPCLPPLKSESEWAIKSLKDGKSPGCDNIQAKMIKANRGEGLDKQVMYKDMGNGTVAYRLERCNFYSIAKKLKKGDLQLCSNYRRISLISHASKILPKVIMKRMENKLEEEVSNTQAGFGKNRGTRDHIFNLKMIIQKYWEVNTDLHTCFIDYSKAFDCVKHEKLWQTLQEMNFDNKIISLIKSLYEDQQLAVQLENGTTEWFPVTKGVRQGCILSPHLFSLYTEGMMREVEYDPRSGEYDEPRMQGLSIRDLRYADDTALLATTTTGLENLIKSVKEHNEQKRIVPKC